MTPISAAESRVMQILWQQAPRSAEDIIHALDDVDWQDKTIKTLLNRLLHKGAISAERDGRRYLYSPRLKREDWQTEESRRLLERVFDGRLAPMLVHFSRHEHLDANDLRELRKLVESIERQHKPED